jgi:hypothetical protein
MAWLGIEADTGMLVRFGDHLYVNGKRADKMSAQEIVAEFQKLVREVTPVRPPQVALKVTRKTPRHRSVYERYQLGLTFRTEDTGLPSAGLEPWLMRKINEMSQLHVMEMEPYY